MKINSHDRFGHANVKALGYDWSRAGLRDIAPVHPKHVYFPTTAEEVSQAVRDAQAKCLLLQRSADGEARRARKGAMIAVEENAADANALDEQAQVLEERAEHGFAFRVRGSGHSDNDLILSSEEPVICTHHLDWIGRVRRTNSQLVIDVGAGVKFHDLDERLEESQLSLKIRPDHDHITVGGFASAGGVSSAAHRHGLFIDTVHSIVFAYRENGQLARIESSHDDFFKVLGGTGEFGVIVSLTCEVEAFSKRRRLLRTQVGKPIESSIQFGKRMRDIAEKLPPARPHIRGIWVHSRDPQTNQDTRVGLISDYSVVKNPKQSEWASRNELIERLEAIGNLAGQLDPNLESVEVAVKAYGFQAILNLMFQAIRQEIFLTDYDVETLTDRVIDSSVGSPTRMLAAFVPAQTFERAFPEIEAYCAERRNQDQLASYVIYSRPIRSRFLSGPGGRIEKYLDLSIFMFLWPDRRRWEAGDQAFRDIAQFLDRKCQNVNNCTLNSMYRYMATYTPDFRPGDDDERNPSRQWHIA